MARLPTVGGDTGTWGTVLNEYLSVAHNADGTLRGVYDVQAYGALGNNSNDDTAEIQAAITAAVTSKAGGGIIFFPAGIYRISSTLTFPSGSGGGRVMGSGAYLGDPLGSEDRWGSQTILVWTGADGGTMIEQAGSLAWNFDNLTLMGRPDEGDANRAGIGYLCSWVTGLGSGVGKFTSCSFYDMDVSLQMGELSTDGNCADMAFDTCNWWSVDTCLLVKNTQGLNYRFDSPSVVSAKRFVHCENGGSVLVNMLNTAGCGGAGATEWVFLFDSMDDSTGACIINGWRAEQDTKQLVKAQYLGHITINGFEEAQADQNVTMVSILGVTVTMRDSRIITHDATNPFFSLARGGGGQQGGLFLDNIHFDEATWAFNDWFKLTSGQDVALKVQNSGYGNLSERLVDRNSHIAFGPVTHFGQTTTATDRWLTLDGTTSYNFHNLCRLPADSTWLIDAYIVGQEVGGGADVGAFHRRAVVKNVAGTLSMVGSEQTIGTDQNTDVWAVVLQVDSSFDAVTVDVTGKVSTTINWKSTIVGYRADAVV
jgi:hypothetical protein